jgi:hypothetical protein
MYLKPGCRATVLLYVLCGSTSAGPRSAVQFCPSHKQAMYDAASRYLSVSELHTADLTGHGRWADGSSTGKLYIHCLLKPKD